MQDPLKYYNNNMVSTLRLLGKIKEYGARLVYSSTTATYGELKTYLFLRLTDGAINPYGETKPAVKHYFWWMSLTA